VSTLAIDIQTGVAQSEALTQQQIEDSICRTVEILHGATFPEHVAELRVIQRNGPLLSGFFSDAASLAAAVAAYEAQGRDSGIYIGLNPVTFRHGMNRGRLMPAGRGGTAGDADVARLQWLFLDWDTKRTTGTNASDDEKEAARLQMEVAKAHFAAIGWPELVTCDSGNGYHLLAKIDLPNTPVSAQLVKSVTAEAARRFSAPQVHLDTSVSNASRITRAYATLNKKGPETPDRPWRRSAITSSPEVVVPLTIAQLTAFAAGGGATVSPSTPQVHTPPEGLAMDWRGEAPSRFNMSAFIETNSIHVRSGPHDYQGGKRWLITCPFDSTHDRGETALFIDSTGMAGFHCWHASCQDYRGWSHFTAELRSRGMGHPEAIVVRTATPNLDRLMIPDMFNDYGNAQRFKVLHGEDAKFCHGMRRWFLWDGSRWCVDEKQEAYKLATLTMVEALRQATRAGNGEAVKFAKASLDARRIDNLLRLVQSDLAISPQEMDLNPWLLNFKNGTFDFQGGQLREHRRGDLITKLNSYDFDAEAKAPTFQKVLERVTRGVEALRPYLQQALGYSLTGTTREKAFFVCHGPSGTGKTTLLTAVRNAFPEYSTNLQVETLMAKSGGLDNNAQSDLADLRGMRFAQTSETEQGQRLKEGQLKRLTQGTGMIKAARKYENLVQFTESHKLWMDANHLPTIRDGTGVFERLHVIPFRNVIEETEQNTNIHAELEAERAGIAAWVVQGARDWMKVGRLVRPPEVQAEGQEYKESQDPMADWITECCITGESAERVSTDRLRSSFNDFASRTGDRPLSQTHFKERMEARGFKYHRANGLRFFVGIALAPRTASDFMAA